MPCQTFVMDEQPVVICRPEALACRRIMHCWTCERRRLFVQKFGGVWYPDVLTCLTCGDSWSSEGRMERPWVRAWRKEAVRRARKLLDEAIPRAVFRARVRALVEDELEQSRRDRERERQTVEAS